MIPQIKHPSLHYGLGVRSPFLEYETNLKPIKKSNAQLWTLLEKNDLLENTTLEKHSINSAKMQEYIITKNTTLTLSHAAHITIEKDALLTIINNGTGLIIIEIVKNTRAKVKIQTHAKQRTITYIKSILYDDADMELNDVVVSDEQVFHRCTSALHNGATLRPFHAFISNADIDFRSKSVHIGKYSSSDMKIKGILLKGQAISQGDILIKPTASHANGYQKEELLFLGSNAIALPIPNLEIGNNDVKCSHGATVSNIDEEFLFYAQSRGLSKEVATNMFTSSFLEPLLTLYNNQEKEEMKEMIAERYI